MGLYAVQRGVCPGYGFHRPHHLRFEANHMVALSDDGEDEVLPLLQSGEGNQGEPRFQQLRAHNVAEGMMVDERLAVLTGRRLLGLRALPLLQSGEGNQGEPRFQDENGHLLACVNFGLTT